MPETDYPMLPILLPIAVGLLVFVFMLCWSITRQLARIERQLTEIANRSGPETSPPSHAETQVGGAFETFLSEDPARRLLPKAEQFAAYRKWRHENGLNWSGS